MQLARQLTFRQWVEAESDVCRFLPSYVYELYDHPNKAANAGWWVVAVQHSGEQPGVLEHEAPSGRGQRYVARVTAIPHMTRFLPPLVHPKTRVEGVQTAIITGPQGEEIYPDKYGRVKVQFHWDREGQNDEKTTCWIRASQGWAGSTYGNEAVPRMGQTRRPPLFLKEQKCLPGKIGKTMSYSELERRQLIMSKQLRLVR